MASARPAASPAAALAIGAAFVWSTYYVFVLWLGPLVSPVATILYPFLFGGIAFLALAWARGEAGAFASLWVQPAAWARIFLIALLQVATVAATYTAGPIDSSLLALIGDVVAVPLLLMAIYGEDRPLVRSPWFLAGVIACLVGGALSIVGGHPLTPIYGWALLVIPTIPLTIGFYFLMTAHAARTAPATLLNGQAFLGAALVVAAVSPLFPGGSRGLEVVSGEAVGLFVALGLSTFFLAQWLYFVAIGRGGLVTTAIWMSLIPAFTLLLSVVVLGIAPAILGALGVPLAIAGAFIALEGQRKVNEKFGPSSIE